MSCHYSSLFYCLKLSCFAIGLMAVRFFFHYSVQFRFPVVSYSLWPHGLQHARLPHPSLTPGACSDTSIELVMPSNHLVVLRPFLLLPSIFPSSRVLSNELVLCIRWPEYWNFIFSISPSNEYSGLISFRIDWFDLAVQGTLESLLHPHSSKASILRCSAFFIVHYYFLFFA